MKTTTLQKLVLWVAGLTAAVLLIPLIGMQVSDEVNWSVGDFVLIGTLLFTAGMGYVLASRTAGSNSYRAAAGLAVAAGLMLIWSNLAVGIIGAEDNPANLMYVAVPAVGLVGAVVTRLKASGMFMVLLATAGVQALITLLALLMGMQYLPGSSVMEILAINGFFIALFLASAALFRKAAGDEPALS